MDPSINLQDNDPAKNQQIKNPPPEHLDSKNSKGSEPITMVNFYKKTSSPVVALVSVLIKLSAVISFILLSLFTDNEAIVMLVVILLGAADFWFTKNITGRILVGLRWWNQIKKETNQEVWIFESKNESNTC